MKQTTGWRKGAGRIPLLPRSQKEPGQGRKEETGLRAGSRQAVRKGEPGRDDRGNPRLSPEVPHDSASHETKVVPGVVFLVGVMEDPGCPGVLDAERRERRGPRPRPRNGKDLAACVCVDTDRSIVPGVVFFRIPRERRGVLEGEGGDHGRIEAESEGPFGRDEDCRDGKDANQQPHDGTLLKSDSNMPLSAGCRQSPAVGRIRRIRARTVPGRSTLEWTVFTEFPFCC